MNRIKDLYDDLTLFGPGYVVGNAIESIKDNPARTMAVVAATTLSGGAALACAPAIGAAVSAVGFGVAGGSLSGAAATSAGLAALGGGSLAAGGAGMAGGTALVTVAGGATGLAGAVKATDRM